MSLLNKLCVGGAEASVNFIIFLLVLFSVFCFPSAAHAT